MEGTGKALDTTYLATADYWGIKAEDANATADERYKEVVAALEKVPAKVWYSMERRALPVVSVLIRTYPSDCPVSDALGGTRYVDAPHYLPQMSARSPALV